MPEWTVPVVPNELSLICRGFFVRSNRTGAA